MKKLYQITDLEGHIVEPSVLVEDICRMYEKKPHQVRAAIAGAYAEIDFRKEWNKTVFPTYGEAWERLEEMVRDGRKNL